MQMRLGRAPKARGPLPRASVRAIANANNDDYAALELTLPKQSNCIN